MRYVVAFGRFWYDFIIGDDWRVAFGVVVALVVILLATHHGSNWWWCLPLVVPVLLGVSLAHAVRERPE